MSGVKRSDVIASIGSYRNSCEQEIGQMSQLATQHYPALKQTSPKVDKALIEKYFPGELQRLEKAKQDYFEHYQKTVKEITRLCQKLDKKFEEPQQVIAQLAQLQSDIEASGRYHGLDSEYKKASSLGNKLTKWKHDVRHLQAQIKSLESKGESLANIPTLYTACDQQILDLAKQGEQQQAQEKLAKQINELKIQAQQVINNYDVTFAKHHVVAELQNYNALKCQVDSAEATVDSLNGLLRKLNASAAKVEQTKLDYQRRANLQLKTVNEAASRFANMKIYDPLQDESIALKEFYNQHLVEKTAALSEVTRRLEQIKGDIGNYQFAENQTAIEAVNLEIEKIAGQARDDSVKVGEIIDTALSIREKMLESRVVGEEQVNITTDEILKNGLRIETVIPEGAYFQLNSDGSLTSDVDVISGNCIKGMQDIAEALARNGIMLHPSSYRLPEGGDNNVSTEQNQSDTRGSKQ